MTFTNLPQEIEGLADTQSDGTLRAKFEVL